MRAILATFGTEGDVAPFLEIGRELARRGHDVEVVTDEAHRALGGAHGLATTTPFRRYDPAKLTGDPRYAKAGSGPYLLWRDIFLPLVPEMFAAVCEGLRRPTDVVLVHPWCFGALYAAEAAGVPAVSVAMAPVTWWSAEDPGLYSAWRPPAALHRGLLGGPVRWLLDGLFGRGLGAARRDLGLPAVRAPFFALGRDVVASYGLWSPALRGPAADDPRGALIAGFLGGGADAPLSPELASFLDAGPAPVVVGTGSLLPPMAGDVYSAAERAVRQRGLRAVVVGADPALGSGDVLVVPRAPYSALFRRARTVVHHGGAGTLAEALRAGRPQVIVPFGNDQFDNGWRAERLGVARSLPRQSLAAGALGAALLWAEGEAACARAEEISHVVRAERDASELVADDLEQRFARRA